MTSGDHQGKQPTAGPGMASRHLSPATVKPPFGRYEHAVEVVGAGRLLFVSGQLGIRPDGSVPEGVAAQTEQALANVEACLEAAGFARRHVVRLTTFLTDAEDRPGYMAARDAWVADPPPASTLVIVKALVLPACKVEVEAMAAD
jgi:enamine deaminase RidA (YjgF/YER057c/UK114 family)